MRLIVLCLVAMLALMACLPDVSTVLEEIEARAMLENEIIDLCENDQSSSGLSNLLGAVDGAGAIAARHHWAFRMTVSASSEELEALVFPSGVVSGSFIRFLRTRGCR